MLVLQLSVPVFTVYNCFLYWNIPYVAYLIGHGSAAVDNGYRFEEHSAPTEVHGLHSAPTEVHGYLRYICKLLTQTLHRC